MDTRNIFLTAHWKTFDKKPESSRSIPEKSYKTSLHLKKDTPKNEIFLEIQKFQKYHEGSFLKDPSSSF